MKKLTIKYQGELPTLYEVEEFELMSKISLPSDYKQFLVDYNPKAIEESYYLKNDKLYVLNGFNFFGKEGMTLQKSFEYSNKHYLNKFIAFAHDSGGWHFVISLRNSDYGKIYFCRLDEELENALELLAENFEEFINGLRNEE